MQASPADVDCILSLRDDAARWMVERGIDQQWCPGELPRAMIEERVDAGAVFLLQRLDTDVAGTVTVLWSEELIWDDNPIDAGYVHMLVVAESARGVGLGRALLAWAEDYVAMAGRSACRLDCARSNARLRQWYEDAGYRHVGDKEFTTPPWARPVALYEKRLP